MIEKINRLRKVPIVTKNKIKIGLLFGSFNPPHQGHVEISKRAKKILNLNDIYWVVTPKNPLKDQNTLLPIEKRLEKVQKITQLNRFRVTDIEIKFKLNYTYQSIRRLRNMQPYSKFVFIIGADIVPEIFKWRFIHFIINEVDIFIESRPKWKNKINSTKFAIFYQKNRKNKIIFSKKTWMYDDFVKNKISSTMIRKAKNYNEQ